MRMGVPTAPKETGVLWITMPATTAAIAGNPSPAKSGTQTAAGVPNPAAPSMNEPKSQATTIVWTRRSGEMPSKPARIACRPPLSRKVSRRRIAPKMIKRIVAVMTSPLTEAATTWIAGVLQMPSASRTTAT